MERQWYSILFTQRTLAEAMRENVSFYGWYYDVGRRLKINLQNMRARLTPQAQKINPQ